MSISNLTCSFNTDESKLSIINQLNETELGDVVNWMIEKEGYSEKTATEAKNEFLKFAALAIFSNGELIENYPIVPPREADNFWHSFLMFNSSYNKWCLTHFGKIINHFPGQAMQDSWEMTKMAAGRFYNESWTIPGASSASFREELKGAAIWSMGEDCPIL